MSNNDYASKQLNKIHNRIATATRQVARDVTSVTLIGAAKQQTAALLRSFQFSGLQHIGENYLGEGIKKQSALMDLPLTWHFIGKVQSNKTKLIAAHFSWVHAIDRLKIAQRFDTQAPLGKKLQVLIQLDLDNEASKGGIDLVQAPVLCAQINELPNLALRGFMLLPRPRVGFDEQRKPFSRARKLLEQINQRYGLNMDTLSMGMSNDLEAAIAEGSTMVRIGTDLFGSRPK